MVLYIDETENKDMFIVAGLLVRSKEEVNDIYKRLKRRVRNMPLSAEAKSRIFNEFKSTLLDGAYHSVKKKLLETLQDIDCTVYYGCYRKKNGYMNQNEKEDAYIRIAKTMSSRLKNCTSIIFDLSGRRKFDQLIIAALGDDKIISVEGQKSELEPGLQYVDNICNVIRNHLSGRDEKNFYALIEMFTNDIDF